MIELVHDARRAGAVGLGGAMGWGFRKSVSMGPMRFTLGKKGVGMSVGVRGARVGIGADGRARAAVSVPGTGLSWRASGGSVFGGGPGYSPQDSGGDYDPRSGRTPHGFAAAAPPSSWRILLGLCLVFVALGSVLLTLLVSVAIRSVVPVAAGVMVGLALFASGSILVYRDRVVVRRANEDDEGRRLAFVEHERQQHAYEREQQRRARHAALEASYGAAGADSIMRRQLWIGAPEPAVREIFGAPDDVEERVLKTKTKRILKYRDPSHAGRYVTKVTLDDGAVVGWEDR